jgi:hypothetical protein
VSRTKIVVHRNGWRRLLALMCISMVVVILTLLSQPWTDYTRPGTVTSIAGGTLTTGPKIIHVGIIVVSFVVLPLWLAGLSWSEQRWGYAVLEALAICLGYEIARISCSIAHISSSISSSVAHISSSPFNLLNSLASTLAIIVIYLPVRLIALAFVRFAIVSMTYQDGTLCSSCGYNLTGNLSGVCPECGVTI